MILLSNNILIVLVVATLMGIISIGLLIFLKKEEIRLIRLFLWILYYFVIFGFTGFIAAQIQYFPTAFWIVEGISLVIGIGYMLLAPRTLSWWISKEFPLVFLTAETFISWGILGMSLVYGLLSKQATTFLPYLVLGVLPFLVPLIFERAYRAITTIPNKRYKRWLYPEGKSISPLERVEVINVAIKFTKLAEEGEFFDEKNNVELPRRLPLGYLFHYFINFYNEKDGKQTKKIYYKNNGRLFEWEFYRINRLKQREYLDPDKSLLDNGVTTNDTIYAVSFT